VIRGSKRKPWSISRPDPYPEFGFDRTLSRAILEIIASSGRQVAVKSETDEVFSAYLRKNRRTAFISLAWDKRMFLSSLSSKGVTLAHLNTSDLNELARAVEFWLLDELTLRDMKERLANLAVSEVAFETERGNGVTARWNLLLSPEPWLRPEFIALVSAAATRPLLRQLFPVVSIGRYLSFSRTIGYPFLIAGGCAEWIGNDRYRALGPDRRPLGEGTIEEVLDLLERVLPSDTGPAILGTADDFIAD
jgi:uncharacterized protein DUF6193